MGKVLRVVRLDTCEPDVPQIFEQPPEGGIAWVDRQGVSDRRHPAGSRGEFDGVGRGEAVSFEIRRPAVAEELTERLCPVAHRSGSDEGVGDVRAAYGVPRGLAQHVIDGDGAVSYTHLTLPTILR